MNVEVGLIVAAQLSDRTHGRVVKPILLNLKHEPEQNFIMKPLYWHQIRRRFCKYRLRESIQKARYHAHTVETLQGCSKAY